jgi:hypothetical protein
MDPNATYHEMISALASLTTTGSEDDRDDAIEHLRSLASWLDRGGFAPTVAMEDAR